MTESIKSALEKAKYPVGKTRLYTTAVRQLRDNRSNAFLTSGPFIRIVSRDPDLLVELVGAANLQSLAHAYLQAVALDMSSGGNAGAGQRASETQFLTARVNSGQTGYESKGAHAGKGTVAADAAKPIARLRPSPRSITARATTVKSVLDTYRIIDGRSIGSVKFHEIGGLIASNKYEAALFGLIKRHFAKVDDESRTIKSLVNDETFNRFKQEAHRVAQDA